MRGRKIRQIEDAKEDREGQNGDGIQKVMRPAGNAAEHARYGGPNSADGQQDPAPPRRQPGQSRMRPKPGDEAFVFVKLRYGTPASANDLDRHYRSEEHTSELQSHS